MQDASKVRKFTARSYSDALRQVKEALGSDAVILSNRLIEPESGDEDRRQQVELTAAVGDVAAGLVMQASRPRSRAHRHEPMADPRRSGDVDVLKPFRRRLLEEEVRERVVQQVLDGVTRRVLALGPRGMPRALDFLLMELMERIQVMPEERSRGYARMTCLVGLSGTGKTTMLAKLGVTAALRERHRVAFVGIGRRGGNREALRMASAVIECPLKEVDSPQALTQLLNELVGYDQIFLDVQGVSPFDERGLEQLRAYQQVAPGVENHLVLNASHRDVDLLKAVECFGPLGIKALAFARLDEACCYGALLNAVDSARLPLSYFSFGREIPSDLELASRERVLDLLLDLSTQDDFLAAQVG